MSTIFKDMSTGCGRSVVIRLAATLIVVPLGILFIFVPLWLVSAFDLSPWLLAVSAGLYLAILFGGGAVYVGVVLYQRRNKLDAVFVPLGLTGQAYQTLFRQYHGTIQGRQVDVYFYRGPALEINISTPLQTRLGVTGRHADTRVLASLFGQQPLVLDDPGLSDLTVFAPDEAWARSLLANPHVPDLLQRLTALESFFTRQQVILRPGAFRLMFSGNKYLFKLEFVPEQVDQWFDDVLRLARIAEHLPAPQVTAEETSVERFGRSLRNLGPYWTLWIALGTLVGILVCSGVVVAAVLLLDRLQ